MNKLAIIPIFFLTMCGTAPVTDPPAHAQKVDKRDLILLPREEAKGEIDITNPYHFQSLQMMFQRNVRKGQIEKNATLPSDAINNALAEFNYGSNGSTESEELLQLPSNGNQ